VVEASVYALRGDERELVARLNATMAVVRPKPEATAVPSAPAG